MLEVPIYNTDGKKIDALQVDEQVFGGQVNITLLKQAIVTYHANKRQGTTPPRAAGGSRARPRSSSSRRARATPVAARFART